MLGKLPLPQFLNIMKLLEKEYTSVWWIPNLKNCKLKEIVLKSKRYGKKKIFLTSILDSEI